MRDINSVCSGEKENYCYDKGGRTAAIYGKASYCLFSLPTKSFRELFIPLKSSTFLTEYNRSSEFSNALQSTHTMRYDVLA